MPSSVSVCDRVRVRLGGTQQHERIDFCESQCGTAVFILRLCADDWELT